MLLLREIGYLLGAAAVVMALVRPLRWRAGLAVAVVVAALSAHTYYHELKPQGQGQRDARGLEGLYFKCGDTPCRRLKDISYEEKIDQTGRSKGSNQDFLRWAAAKMGEKDRYYLITGPKDGPTTYWNTYFLLPRLALWDEGPGLKGRTAPRDLQRMARADWVVVYGDSPPRSNPPGAVLGEPMRFEKGFYLVKVNK